MIADTYADLIEARLATAQKAVERLTPATLAKAFRGELAHQDIRDEPAGALLFKIEAERKLAKNGVKLEKSKDIAPSMSILELINERFDNKPFTFEELRSVAKDLPYDELKQSLFEMLRPSIGSKSAITVLYNDSSETMEFAMAKFFSKCELMRRKPGVASIEGKSKATQSIELLPTYPPATHTIRNSQQAWHMVHVGHGG